MKMGDNVRLIQPVVSGVIVDTEYDKSTEQLRHLVDYQAADGEQNQRWFLESELEVLA